MTFLWWTCKETINVWVCFLTVGFTEVFKELPMEFAVEAQKLLEISLEGSVG